MSKAGILANKKAIPAINGDVSIRLLCRLIGGGLSGLFFIGEPVFSQKVPQYEKVIKSQSFEVVDEKGNSRIAIGTQKGEPIMILMGKNANSMMGFAIADEVMQIALSKKRDK